MRRWIVVLGVGMLIVAVVGAGWWYVGEHPEWLEWAERELTLAASDLGLQPAEEPPGLVASGFIEANEASVTTELGGRIVALFADEGDEVEADAVLVQLDDSMLLSQIQVAEAELGVAQARLARVKAGVRPESVDHARALLHQALAVRDAARVEWEDAQAMLENPQELQLALTAAQAQLSVLDWQEQQAQAFANSAQVGRDLADASVQLLEDFDPREEWVRIGNFGLGNLPPDIPLPPDVVDGEYYLGKYKIVVRGTKVSVYVKVKIKVPAAMEEEANYEQAMATYQSWEAWTGYSQAQTARSGAESYLQELVAQRNSPLALQAQANAAEAQFEVAASGVALAKAHLDGLQIGATEEQIAAADSQVEMAQAALDTLLVQASKYGLSSPISGLVLERPVHVGEVALPGAPLMTLADLENMTLTVYVPESELGRVQIGQPVEVSVDAYPEQTFRGTVSFIANEAEFTPKNVQTREERVNMVFAVKVKLPNPDHALKPGMPADAVLLDVE
ncbi:MAG: efflux RND transporter periplasmic adaptor subunit [Anaerolineae bacterium]